MEVEKNVEKLDKYFRRLEKGKAKKIKPAHVEKIIRKLNAKLETLLVEVAESEKESKRARLAGKLETVKEQIERAQWLLREIGNE